MKDSALFAREQASAAHLLAELRSKRVPRTVNLEITVGDDFRHHLRATTEKIASLLTKPNLYECILLGDFGTGKTHFLSALQALLPTMCSSREEHVVVRSDLGKLGDATALEMLLFEDMTSAENHTHVETLVRAGRRIQDAYAADARLSGVHLEIVVSLALYALVGAFAGFGTKLISDGLKRGLDGSGALTKDGLEELGFGGLLGRMAARMGRRRPVTLLESARSRATIDCQEFFESFRALMKRSDVASASFEDAARKLSARQSLMDIVLRLLSRSGVKLVVFLIDELETLSRKSDEGLKSALTAIRTLRDLFDTNRYGSEESRYPAIALICTSTDAFFDDAIRQNDPALYTRWTSSTVRMTKLSPADIDSLIFKLRELHFRAGSSLRAVQCTDGSEHEVSLLRKDVLTDLGTVGGPSMRELVSKVAAEVEAKWVR